MTEIALKNRRQSSDAGAGKKLEAGYLIDGRYEIESVLGEGTFACVYLARHTTISNLQCAIKVLKPAFVTDHELREQFRHEAETIARLSNKHTVRVSDFGELPDGRPYICMEYCIGATLDRVLDRVGALDEALVAHIGKGVLYSLREAHAHEIVHRDIKPSNISLTEDVGRNEPLTRVLDFGIAYIAQHQPLEAASAESDLVFCTPSYAAPEVLRGTITPAADVYALGLTLAELLDGEPVYANTGFYTVAARQLSAEAIPFGPKTRASVLFPLIEKACRKNAEERFQSANEMLECLLTFESLLPRSAQLAWEFLRPEHCVGVRRCSLASDQLDMPLPAGCAMGQCEKSAALQGNAHLRVPADDSDDEHLPSGPTSTSKVLHMLQNADGFVALLAGDSDDGCPRRNLPAPDDAIPEFEAETSALVPATADDELRQAAERRLKGLDSHTKAQRRVLRVTDVAIAAGIIVLVTLLLMYGLPG